MSTVTQKEISDFSDHCTYIRSAYLFALRLFKNSTATERESMKIITPLLFEVLDQVFAEFVVIAACRITDKAKSQGHENLTVETFVNGFASDPERATIAEGQPLPSGSWAEWDEFWQTLADFVRILSEKATGNAVEITTGDAQRDGDMLFNVLGQSKRQSK